MKEKDIGKIIINELIDVLMSVLEMEIFVVSTYFEDKKEISAFRHQMIYIDAIINQLEFLEAVLGEINEENFEMTFTSMLSTYYNDNLVFNGLTEAFKGNEFEKKSLDNFRLRASSWLGSFIYYMLTDILEHYKIKLEPSENNVRVN